MSCENINKCYPVVGGPYSSDWEALSEYRCPEWFGKARFGIWAFWGVQAVPMMGDFYARGMYTEGSPQYEYHVKHYGHPSEFGYKDLIPLWKAENFDPEYLIGLYKKAGARYFLALAAHHENVDMWDSTYHRWCATRIGPNKDIVGLWQKAAYKHNLPFGVYEGLERSYCWFNVARNADKSGPYAGVPYDGVNPDYWDLYWEPHGDQGCVYPENPSDAFMQTWYKRIKDLIDRYRPELLFSDGGMPFGEVGRRMMANYYNLDIRDKNGVPSALYLLKDFPTHGDYRPGVGVLDLEIGVTEEISAEPWQCDICIGGWHYDRNIEYKSARQMMNLLVDIASKNGNMLLNFPLMPDGTLDDREMKVLSDITDWMAVNGEAIHDTVPWDVYAEGPSRFKAGEYIVKGWVSNNFNAASDLPWTNEDFRFTSKGGTVYAFFMTWPDSGTLRVKSLASGSRKRPIGRASLLGDSGELRWTQGTDGLDVSLPENSPGPGPWALKLELS